MTIHLLDVKIRKALEKGLLAYTPPTSDYPALPQVIDWGEQPFVRPGSEGNPEFTPWVRSTLSYASSDPHAFGTVAERRDTGVHLIDLFYPPDDGKGRLQLEILAAGLRLHYKVGRRFIEDDVSVRISGFRRTGSVNEGIAVGYLAIPCSAEWSVDWPNQ